LAAVLSLHRAKVIQALLDSTIGELPEVRELQWDELMPFERAELDRQTKELKCVSMSGQS
jgi:hypothetical protein